MVPPSHPKAHVFVDDLTEPVLTEDDHRHLTRVLRLVPGDEVSAADGRGRWRLCRLDAGAELEVAGEVVTDPRPDPPLTIAFALVKGERPELVVQKLTELGIDRIVPFVAERSVVRWDEAKAARQMSRLASIARQAAMQCRRSRLPHVGLGEAAATASDPPIPDFAAVARLPGAALADRVGGPPSLSTPTVLIGPEGGWGAAERGVDLPLVRVGEHVLRAETAALTAGALLGALRSQLVRHAVPPQVDGPHGP